MRFSRAKPTGSFRVFHPSSRRVAAHTDTLGEARKDAAFWTKTTTSPIEIQERFPSGEWVTVETAGRKSTMTSAARPKRASAARSQKSHAVKKTAPSSKAVDFFRKHAGYSVRPGESKAKGKTRGAQALARAEAEAEARGWTVEWNDDPEEWWGDVERPFEVLTAVLRDADGRSLASLGGIGMTGTRKTDADYRRVIEAELADEAIG